MQKRQRDIAKEAISLFQQLQQRRIQLQRWLDEIDEALNTVRGTSQPATSRVSVRTSAPKQTRRKGRGQNEMPLREAVSKAVSQRPLNRQEILKEVGKLGYKFNSKNPMKSLDVFLYGTGKHLFKRVDGKFSLSGNRTRKNGTGHPARAKRTMSAEGRRKIAAAARARWARVRAAR